MPTVYAQLAGSSFTPSEIADPSATITQHDPSLFELTGAGVHAGWKIQFHSSSGEFTYNGSNEPITPASGGLVSFVDIWNGSTKVATFTSLSGLGSEERYLDGWWTTYLAGGAKTGAPIAFNGLFGATNQTGDANDNALETFDISTTLNGGAGGNDRYRVNWTDTTIDDGAGNGTVEVLKITGSIDWDMGGGTNTLTSFITEFDAHVAAGDSLVGFNAFKIGAGGQNFDLDAAFVPANATFTGPLPANVFLRIGGAAPSYDASNWNVAAYPGKVALDASAATGALTLKAPNARTTFLGNGDGNANFTGGNKNDAAQFFGGGNNDFDGKGGTDTIFLSGTPNSSIVTRTGINSFHIAEPGGQVIDVVNVEKWSSPSGEGNLADVAPAAPINHPPKIVKYDSTSMPLGQSDHAVFPTFQNETKSVSINFSDEDGDKLTYTAVLLSGGPLPTWLTFSSDGVFNGNAPAGAALTSLDILVTANDGRGGFATLYYTIYLDGKPIWEKIGTIKAKDGQKKVEDLGLFAYDPDLPFDERWNSSRETSNIQSDFENQQLTFSIAGGPDKKLFKLAADSGVLKFKKAPDLKHPKDSNHDNLYKVKVSVSDGFFSDETMLKVKVKGNKPAKVAENSPETDAGVVEHHGHWLFDA